MADRSAKSTVVAFKVEPELAELLNKLPNKSAFIRKAIAAQLGVACPLCQGEGIVLPGVHEHVAPLLQKLALKDCDSCGGELQVQLDTGDLSSEDKERLQQYFLGGPLYCGHCYEKAPACNDCGWHIDDNHLAEHKHAHKD